MTEEHSKDTACETAATLTYGMSPALRDGGLLKKVDSLSHQDRAFLIRYIRQTDEQDMNQWEDLDDDLAPYTMEELNARIDEAEDDIERGEGKSFEEMMDGFKQQLLWLK